MSMFENLKLSDTTSREIDWEMTPHLAFVSFVSKGLHKESCNTGNRICYFFIDNWGEKPKLCLMERGLKYAKVLAEIKAPLEMLQACVKHQGGTSRSRENYAIDPFIKEWLLANVVDSEDSPYLVPVIEEQKQEDMGETLPLLGEAGFSGGKIVLPTEQSAFTDDQIASVIHEWNFFDAELNREGKFDNALVNTGDGLTIIDERSGLMWQRAGLDIASTRSMKQNIEQLNKEGFAGHHDWRMPSLEEAMSLMETSPNAKGVYLNPCFSKEQPFIFVVARRKPTGYWFVDYKQGRAYWSSGTVPGGFCKLCRRID